MGVIELLSVALLLPRGSVPSSVTIQFQRPTIGQIQVLRISDRIEAGTCRSAAGALSALDLCQSYLEATVRRTRFGGAMNGRVNHEVWYPQHLRESFRTGQKPVRHPSVLAGRGFRISATAGRTILHDLLGRRLTIAQESELLRDHRALEPLATLALYQTRLVVRSGRPVPRLAQALLPLLRRSYATHDIDPRTLEVSLHRTEHLLGREVARFGLRAVRSRGPVPVWTVPFNGSLRLETRTGRLVSLDMAVVPGVRGAILPTGVWTGSFSLEAQYP